MKRLVAILVCIFTLFSLMGSFAESNDVPKEFRFESNSDKHYYFVPYDKDITQFTAIDQVIMDFGDQLGYEPHADINEADQVVTFYLYKTQVEVHCLIDKLSGIVIIPDFYLPDDLVELNDLSDIIRNDREWFNIQGLATSDCEIAKIDIVRDKRLDVTFSLGGKEIDLSTYSVFEDNGRIYISRNAYIQFYYEINW